MMGSFFCGEGYVINWEAWTAIGTILLAVTAVAVPAWLRWSDEQRERLARAARAEIKAFRLYEELGEYLTSLNRVRSPGEPAHLDAMSAMSFCSDVQIACKMSADLLLRLEHSEDFGEDAINLAAIITSMVRTSDDARKANLKANVPGRDPELNGALLQTQNALIALKAAVEDAKELVRKARDRRL